MKYTYDYSLLWSDSTAIVDQEIAELTSWLHRTEIDPEFDPDTHVYIAESGDRWFFLPELSERQEMAVSLIMTSSTLRKDDAPVRFDLPPNAQPEDYDDV